MKHFMMKVFVKTGENMSEQDVEQLVEACVNSHLGTNGEVLDVRVESWSSDRIEFDDYDGQPDEQTEWADFDPDC